MEGMEREAVLLGGGFMVMAVGVKVLTAQASILVKSAPLRLGGQADLAWMEGASAARTASMVVGRCIVVGVV